MAETQETQETGSLQDFKFDDDQSWFGIKPSEDSTEEIIKEVKNDKRASGENSEEKNDNPKAEKLPEEEEEEEDGSTFFETAEETAERKAKSKQDNAEDDNEEEEVEEVVDDKKDNKKDESAEDDKFFTTLASELKEKGIFQNIELKEGEEVTEEKFFELQDAEIEARVQETFEAFFEELDEDGKRFLKFKKSGGRTSDFFQSYNTPLDVEEVDLENEEHRTKFLTHYLTTVEKLEADDLKDRLEWLKEGGKEKTYAKKYYESMKSQVEEQKAAMIEQQEKAEKSRAEGIRKFNESLESTLAKTEAVGAFTFTKTDQKELGSYLTKPTVKVGKNKYIPAFQAQIANIFKAETEEDKQKLLLLAKLVKTDFDVTDLVAETQTKVVKKAKSRLQEVKKGVKPSSAGGASKKSLGDYFD